MLIQDNKPFMLAAIPNNIFVVRPPVTKKEPHLPALPVIENLDIFGDIQYNFQSGFIPRLMDKLLLEHPPETLHQRVIVAIPLPAHRYRQIALFQGISEIMRTGLAVSIRTVNQSPNRAFGG